MSLLDAAKAEVAYDPITGVFTRLRSGGHKRRGDIAGYIKADGYRLISVERHYVYAHRLAWLMTYGEMPLGEIDHINGIRDDNRIENLRDCSRSQNMMNRKHRGWHWHSRSGKWQAMIRVNGRRFYLGTFTDEASAKAAYNAAADKHHGKYRRTPAPPVQEAMAL